MQGLSTIVIVALNVSIHNYRISYLGNQTMHPDLTVE